MLKYVAEKGCHLPPPSPRQDPRIRREAEEELHRQAAMAGDLHRDLADLEGEARRLRDDKKTLERKVR